MMDLSRAEEAKGDLEVVWRIACCCASVVLAKAYYEALGQSISRQ